MYKLLIAEDEDYIREAIVNCISTREEIGFEVEQAEDGEMALKIAETYRPDAVLTDIRMPFIDGLELTAHLRKLLPDAIVVILSGHDEFRYAQEAVSLGVMEYITKPIRPQAFSEVMVRLREKLDARKLKEDRLRRLRTQLHQSLPLLREQQLNRMIIKPVESKHLQDRLEFLGLSIKGTAFTVCLLSVSAPEQTEIEETELIEFAVQNVLGEEIGTDGVCFVDNEGRHVVIYCARSNAEQERTFVLNMIEAVKDNIENLLQVTITASVGAPVQSLKELPRSYETARKALESQVLLGKGRVYDIFDTIAPQAEGYYPFAESEELLTKLKFEAESVFLAESDAFLKKIAARGSISTQNLRIVFIDLINGSHRLLLEAGCEDLDSQMGIYGDLFELTTLEEFGSLIKKHFLSVRAQLEAMRTSRSALLIEKVRHYIKNNYHDSSLSLNSAAQQVFISPAYLSILFKRELGTTFIDYVTTLRLEKAKELLSIGGMKTYEAAAKVGYNDPQYFSNCFKKYTGCTPSEYKSRKE